MKILTVIPCYQGNSNPYISKVASELETVSDVTIFSPEPLLGFNTEIVDKALGHNLVFSPREYIISNLENYDYFFYNEDDILVNPSSLLHAIEVNQSISEVDITYAVGFLRFELANNNKEYVDLHPAHSIHRGVHNQIIKQVVEVNNQRYFEPYNIHSGNFLLSKQQIKYLLGCNLFHVKAQERYCGILESGATDVYLGLTKLIPVDSFPKLECHHLSNKYTYNTRKVTEEELKSLING